MNARTLGSISAGVFVGAALLAFTVFMVLSGSDVSAEGTVVQEVDPGYWIIQPGNPDKVEEIAGFKVAQPVHIPGGFVARPVAVSTREGDEYVHQPWRLASDRSVFIALVQNKHYSDLGGGEEFEIAGTMGQRLAGTPGPGAAVQHPMVYYQWSAGGFHYQLFATLAGPVTEELLLRIADSI